VEHFKRQKSLRRPSIIKIPKILGFAPEKDKKSDILNEVMISNFVAQMPTYMQFCSWKRLYKMDEDGRSLITFFDRVKDWDQTILVIQDTRGYVFGGLCYEAWRSAFRFFGDSDTILFTFKDTETPTFSYWSGQGEQFQYADEKSIGLGGCSQKGRFALFLHNDFRRGSSHPVEIFDNEVLS
jgi:hypothetical protein